MKDLWVLRVQHGYGNTHGVSKTGHTGSGTVLEFDNRGYTVPVTTVSRCHAVILRRSSKLRNVVMPSSSALPQASGK